jgi:hypothetical protein
MERIDRSELLMRKDLYLVRKNKLKAEIQALMRIIDKDVEPLELADEFMSSSFTLMMEGVSNKYPELSERELFQKTRELLSLPKKMKKYRKRGNNLG